MAWRPSSRPNPLLALRRVVEHPGDASRTPRGGPNAAGRTSTVRPAPPSLPASGPDAWLDGVSAAIASGGSPAVTTLTRPERGSGRHVHRPPASQPEPSHRDPTRAAQTLITTTPAEATELGDLPPLPPMTPMAAVIVARRTRHELPRVAPATIPPRAAGHSPGPTRPIPMTVDPADAVQALAARSPAVPEPGLLPSIPTPATSGATVRQLRPLQVLTVMVACLGMWALLDAPALQRAASSSHLGTRRRVALDFLGPVSRLSALLGVDRIGRAIDDVRGAHAGTRDNPAGSHPASTPTTPLVLIGPPATSSAGPGPAAPLRVPTASDPLRVLVVGDSLGLSFGQSLAAKLDASGLTRTTVDAREGTGLARPDSFDWVAQLEADIVRFHPEVVVASFGGNDDQDVQVGGRYVGFPSGQWQAIYRARVAKIVSEARAANARLVWSGLPVMRSGTKSARLAVVMSVTRSAVDGQPLALWVGNAGTLADASGRYQAALPDGSGQQVLVREPDGIHETRAGADRLAEHAIASMTTAWDLRLKAPAGG